MKENQKACCPEKETKSSETNSLVKAGKDLFRFVTEKEYDPFVNAQTKAKRLESCQDCDQKISILGGLICGECKCIIANKIAFKDQSCPHPNGPRWNEESS